VLADAEVCSIVHEYSNNNMDTAWVVAHVFCANVLPVIACLVEVAWYRYQVTSICEYITPILF
jgi:hypothetical protein